MTTSGPAKSTFMPRPGRPGVQGLTEYVFKIRSDDNLLCQFTKEHPDVRIVLSLLRPAADSPVESAIVTLLADKQTRTRFLTGQFEIGRHTSELQSPCNLVCRLL